MSPEMRQFLASPEMSEMRDAVSFMKESRTLQAAEVQKRANANFQAAYFKRIESITEAYGIHSPSKALDLGQFFDLVNAKLCQKEQRDVSLEETAEFISREFPEHCGRPPAEPAAGSPQGKTGKSAPQILPSGGGSQSPKGDGSELFDDSFEDELANALG